MNIPLIGDINIGKHWRMIVILFCILWIISPFDFDFIPVIGWIDDLVALLVAAGLFIGGNR